MNTNRRADLQRKLAVAPVPKPPAGLAAKIKSDIPKELRFSAERERARFAQSVRISLAVAASVIVVIAAAYLALQVTDNGSNQTMETRPAAAKHPVLQAPAVVPPPPAAVAQAAAPKPAKETRIAARRQKKQEPEPKNDELLDRAERTEPTTAKTFTITAAAPAVAQNAASVEEQTTTSPISGKRYGFADVRLTPWGEVPREVKLRILKDELAHGADPKEVAKVARDAGLNEFADSVEKKH